MEKKYEVTLPPLTIFCDIFIGFTSGREAKIEDCYFVEKPNELYLKLANGYLTHIPKTKIDYYMTLTKERKNEQ